MNNKILGIGVVVAILLSIVSIASKSPSSPFGGTSTWSGPVNSRAGYLTNGTSTIGPEATSTFTNGTYSGTLAVTGTSTIAKLIEGGATTTISSTATTTTLTNSQACNSKFIDWAAAGSSGDATMTLPSDTVLTEDSNACLTTDGQSMEIIFRNISTGKTTQASSTWIATSTGLVLVSASTTNSPVQPQKIVAGGSVVIKFLRVSASTTLAILQNWIKY